MRRRSTSSMGPLHPVLFFMFVYGISLFLAIFVCRTIYYSVHADVADHTKTEQKSDLSYTSAAASVSLVK